jgi:hypothetical protein
LEVRREIWGDVKHLKSGKRASLTSEQLNWQATIYGTSCCEKAKSRASAEENAFKIWNDTDMESLGLNKFAVEIDPETVAKAQTRHFKCYIEDWEEACIKKESPRNKRRLLEKYGGMVFKDKDERYTISSTQITFFFAERKDGGSRYCLHLLDDDYDTDGSDKSTKYHLRDIDVDLLGMLWLHNEEEGNDRFKFEVKAGSVNEATRDWVTWLKEAPKGSKKKVSKVGKESQRQSPKRPVKRTRKPKARSSK